MKKIPMIIPFVILLCFVVSLCASTTFAQGEEQKAKSYVVMEFVIKPGKIADFEASWKEGIDECKRHHYYLPIYTYSMDDFHFYAFYPVPLYSGIDDFFHAYAEFVKKIGMEKLQKIHEREYASIYYYRMFLIRYKADLSYAPESPRLKQEEANFMYWPFCYVQPGKESEFEKICKEWVDLDKSVNRPNGWDTYVGDIGTDMPFYFWTARARSAADFWSQDEKYVKKVGEEKLMKLWSKTMALLRKFEYKTGWFRPDLSYIPKEK